MKLPAGSGVIEHGTWILILVAFFVSGLVDFGALPAVTAWVTEAALVVMLLEVMRQRRHGQRRLVLVGQPYVWMVLAVCVLSMLVNGTDLLSLVLFLRILLRFYLLLVILINAAIDTPFMRRTNRLLSWLFLLQIPVAVIRLFYFGQGEWAIGTYAYHAGGNSTVIPMLAVAFLLPIHYLYRRSPRNLLIGVAFVAFGIIGGKRGIVILVPVALLIAAACLRWTVGRRAFSRVGILILIATAIGGWLSFYAVARMVPRLNPDGEVWGRFSAAYAVGKVAERIAPEPLRQKERLAQHRATATVIVWRHLHERGLTQVLIGEGPGSYLQSFISSRDRQREKLARLGIGYGLTGLTWMMLQMGLVGALAWTGFYLSMFRLLLKHARREADPYWKAFLVGTMAFTGVAVTVNVIYNSVPLIDDLTSLVYMLLLAFAIKRILLTAAPGRPAGRAFGEGIAV